MDAQRQTDRSNIEKVLNLLGEELLAAINRQITNGWILEKDIRTLTQYLKVRQESPLSSSRLEQGFSKLDHAVEEYLSHLDHYWQKEINPRSIVARKPKHRPPEETADVFARCIGSYQEIISEVHQLFPDLLTSKRLY